MTDETIDKIHDCAESMKEVIEKMGGTQVSILYSYTANDDKEGAWVNSGFAADGIIAAIGTAEFSKLKLLDDIRNS